MKRKPDPLEQALLDGFESEKKSVEDTEEFLSELHAKLKVSRGSLIESQQHRTRRRRLRRSIAWIAALAAGMLLFVVLRPIEVDQPRSANNPLDELNVASFELTDDDAKIGLDLLNSSVGGTLRSVREANQNLQRFFRPIQGKPSQPGHSTAVNSTAKNQRTMLAHFADRVLGICN